MKKQLPVLAIQLTNDDQAWQPLITEVKRVKLRQKQTYVDSRLILLTRTPDNKWSREKHLFVIIQKANIITRDTNAALPEQYVADK